jgi:hypothetical protein
LRYPLVTPSLRAQRSNPGSFRTCSLDRFARNRGALGRVLPAQTATPFVSGGANPAARMRHRVSPEVEWPGCSRAVALRGLRCAPVPPATTASPLRGGDGRICARGIQSNFQTPDTPSHSRGLFRPSFASSCHPLQEKGRREDQAPAGTRGPLCQNIAHATHSGIQVKPEATRPSLRSGLTAYAALSSVTNSFLSPSPRELTMHRHPVGSMHLRSA